MECTTSKPSLILLLGAGASENLGIPSIGVITSGILGSLNTTTEQHAGILWPPILPGQPSPAVLLQGILDQAYPPSANFEHILHALEALESLAATWEENTSPKFRIIEGFLCGGPRGGLQKCFNPFWITAARNALYTSLHSSIDQANRGVVKNLAWPTLRAFLQRLNSEYELYVATINYDQIVEQALGWGAQEQGFDPIPGESVNRFCRHLSPVSRLLHLHGSIQFGYRMGNTDPNRFNLEDNFEDLYWHPSPESALGTWFGRSHTTSQAGRDTIVGPLITGLQKPDKLLVEPYLSYFRHFGHLISTTPRILIIGYGFGDMHINAVLSRLTKWHRAQRRIVVIDFWPEADWLPSPDWGGIKREEFFQCVARCSEDSRAMNVIAYPDPWQPSGPGADCIRVYLRGFGDTVRQHGDNIIRFLQSNGA